MLHVKLKRHQKLQRQRDASPLSHFSSSSSSFVKYGAGSSTALMVEKDHLTRENSVHKSKLEPCETFYKAANQRRVLYKALKNKQCNKTRSFESIRFSSAMSQTTERGPLEDCNVLLLGPPRSGKTTLVKRLGLLLNCQKGQNSAAFEDGKGVPLLPATTPTIGAESSTLEVVPTRNVQSKSPLLHRPNFSRNARRSSSPMLKRQSPPTTLKLQVKELGGKNGTLWHHFLDDGVDVVVYVIDIGNPCQISLAVAQLIALLDSPQLQDASFGIVLNKRDSPCALSGCRFDSISGLSNIISRYPNQCITIETSCRTMENVSKLLSWLLAQAMEDDF